MAISYIQPTQKVQSAPAAAFGDHQGTIDAGRGISALGQGVARYRERQIQAKETDFAVKATRALRSVRDEPLMDGDGNTIDVVQLAQERFEEIAAEYQGKLPKSSLDRLRFELLEAWESSPSTRSFIDSRSLDLRKQQAAALDSDLLQDIVDNRADAFSVRSNVLAWKNSGVKTEHIAPHLANNIVSAASAAQTAQEAANIFAVAQEEGIAIPANSVASIMGRFEREAQQERRQAEGQLVADAFTHLKDVGVANADPELLRAALETEGISPEQHAQLSAQLATQDFIGKIRFSGDLSGAQKKQVLSAAEVALDRFGDRYNQRERQSIDRWLQHEKSAFAAEVSEQAQTARNMAKEGKIADARAEFSSIRNLLSDGQAESTQRFIDSSERYHSAVADFHGLGTENVEKQAAFLNDYIDRNSGADENPWLENYITRWASKPHLERYSLKEHADLSDNLTELWGASIYSLMRDYGVDVQEAQRLLGDGAQSTIAKMFDPRTVTADNIRSVINDSRYILEFLHTGLNSSDKDVRRVATFWDMAQYVNVNSAEFNYLYEGFKGEDSMRTLRDRTGLSQEKARGAIANADASVLFDAMLIGNDDMSRNLDDRIDLIEVGFQSYLSANIKSYETEEGVDSVRAANDYLENMLESENYIVGSGDVNLRPLRRMTDRPHRTNFLFWQGEYGNLHDSVISHDFVGAMDRDRGVDPVMLARTADLLVQGFMSVPEMEQAGEGFVGRGVTALATTLKRGPAALLLAQESNRGMVKYSDEDIILPMSAAIEQQAGQSSTETKARAIRAGGEQFRLIETRKDGQPVLQLYMSVNTGNPKDMQNWAQVKRQVGDQQVPLEFTPQDMLDIYERVFSFSEEVDKASDWVTETGRRALDAWTRSGQIVYPFGNSQ